jgi:hypothetical protein
VLFRKASPEVQTVRDGMETGDWGRAALTTSTSIAIGVGATALVAAGVVTAPAWVTVVAAGALAAGASCGGPGLRQLGRHHRHGQQHPGQRTDTVGDTWDSATDTIGDAWDSVTSW